MTKDTNKEQVTLAESPSNEIVSPASESNTAKPLAEKNEEPAEVQNTEPAEVAAEEENAVPAEAQNKMLTEVGNKEKNEEENTAPKSLRRRAAWYDVLMLILFFLSSQLLGAFIAIKLGVLPADTSLFSSSDFEVIELAESTQARFVAISLLFAMLLCFLMLRIYRAIRNWSQRPSFKSPGWASPIRVLCGYILMWCISIAIEPLTSILPDSQSHIGSGGWLLVSAVLIAPIFEEYLFRGYIAGAIQYAYGSVAAWLLSSVIFGVAHGQPAVMVSATMSGLVLGFYFLRSRSVMIPMI